MKIGIFGYGGHAREVASLLGIKDITFFTDTKYTTPETIDITKFDPTQYKLLIATGDSTIRRSVVNKLPDNTEYLSFIHPTAIISGRVELGEGCYIGPYCILTDNVKIGKHAILNRGVQIGHDCIIGDYFSAMPGAVVSGNVYIGNTVYIGTNSSIKEKITITDNCIIGLNSGVVKNIVNSGVYAGVPAKKIK